MIRVAAQRTSISTPDNLRPAADRSEKVKRVWRHADAVCFDVDSTVCQDEAIDEFAEYLGVGEDVANVTRAAMNGSGRFKDALAARLEVMKPTYEQLEEYVNKTIPKVMIVRNSKDKRELVVNINFQLTPGIKELVKTLHDRGTHVYLVSGGFRRIIRPVADLLNISHSNIFANEIFFDEEHNYAGFDEDELTSDSGTKDVGKPAVITLLKAKHNYKNVVMVGDGATDLEACPPAEAFIGFGGNQIRENVRSRADWYVTNFNDLRKELVD